MCNHRKIGPVCLQRVSRKEIAFFFLWGGGAEREIATPGGGKGTWKAESKHVYQILYWGKSH